MHDRGQILELSVAECRDLLGTDVVGRVAFVTPFGPRIVPVNFALVGDALEFRTTPDAELAVYGPGTEVAFEVDHLDGERLRGWSVVAHGVCERVSEPGLPLPAQGGPGPSRSPWAGGERRVLLRLAWRELTGRRVGGTHWPHPVVSGRGRSY